MATSNLGPIVDVRSVITLARREGERLAGLTRDVQALVFKSPAELAAGVGKLERDVRSRADAAVKGIGAGGALVIGELTKASNAVLRRFAGGGQDEIEALTARVALLEKRLGSIERQRRKTSRRNGA